MKCIRCSHPERSERHGWAELRVIWIVTREWGEADLLVTCSRPDSSERITDIRKNGIEMGDHEVSKLESLRFTEVQILLCAI